MNKVFLFQSKYYWPPRDVNSFNVGDKNFIGSDTFNHIVPSINSQKYFVTFLGKSQFWFRYSSDGLHIGFHSQ